MYSTHNVKTKNSTALAATVTLLALPPTTVVVSVIAYIISRQPIRFYIA